MKIKRKGVSMTWGERVRTLRKSFGETQDVFCERIGISVYALRYWEQEAGEPLGPARKLIELLEKQIEQQEKNGVPA